MIIKHFVSFLENNPGAFAWSSNILTNMVLPLTSTSLFLSVSSFIFSSLCLDQFWVICLYLMPNCRFRLSSSVLSILPQTATTTALQIHDVLSTINALNYVFTEPSVSIYLIGTRPMMTYEKMLTILESGWIQGLREYGIEYTVERSSRKLGWHHIMTPSPGKIEEMKLPGRRDMILWVQKVSDTMFRWVKKYTFRLFWISSQRSNVLHVLFQLGALKT